MKILLFEPDEYYHQNFAEIIGPLGELIIARDTEQAKSFLQSHQPDVVVMELLFPDRTGYEFLEEIQPIRSSRFLPVIIFSKVGSLADIEQSLNYGVSGYFVKGRDTIHDIKNLLLNI